NPHHASISIHDALPIYVLGDPIHLRQVVMNLVVNAAEATVLTADGPREIRIDASQPMVGRIAVAIRISRGPSAVRTVASAALTRSEEHTSELQSRVDLT